MTNFVHRLCQRLRTEHFRAGARPVELVSKKLIFEALEPRLLLSADPGLGGAYHGEPSAIDAPEPPAIVARLVDASATDTFAAQREAQQDRIRPIIAVEQTAARHEVVLVDTSVEGYEQLLGDLLSQTNSDRRVDVHVLHAQRDAIEQITGVLANYTDLDALHLVSHGTTDGILIGSTLLNPANLDAYAGQFQDWQQALSVDADILFYGCNLAQTQDGQQLLQKISQWTSADLAASVDKTGHAQLGGDWDLEYRAGQIETALAFSSEFQAEWKNLLPIYESFTNYTSELEIKSDTNQGQTFQHNSGSGTYMVNEVSLLLRKDSDASAQTLTVTLRDSWNGAILGSATISSSSLGTNFAWYDLNVGNVTLNDNQSYTIQVSSNTTDGKVWTGFNPSGGYPDGTRIDVNGLPLSGEDMAFKIGFASTNTAPTLDTAMSPVLNDINEDAGAPSGAVGTLVSQLVDFASPSGEVDNVTDPDAGALLGIAITAADATNGSWWYSTDNGTSWRALGDVSDSNARLLAADASTRLYFQPNANYNGTSVAITFRAWDQTTGTAGELAAVGSTSTVLDQFSSVFYGNNDGTANWSGNWVENDSNGGGVSGGRIRIDNGRLDIRADAIGDWIYREVNLNGATSATLSLDYTNTLGSGDSIVIQISNDGGASYSTLPGGTFSSSLNTGSDTLDFDITSYISANTRIRFFVATEGSNQHLYLDNIQISYNTTGGSTAFSTASDTATLTVNPVNDAPTASNMSAAETYTLNTPLNLADIVISDVDSANVTATLTLSDPAAGTLSTGTSGLVTSTYDAATGVWTASGAVYDVNALLADVTYNPSLLYISPFTIATSVDDGVAPAITGSKSMAVGLLNLPPLATNLNAAETYTEDTPLDLTDIVVTDLDSPNVTASLTLSDPAAGSLSTGSSGSVTSTYGAGVWRASGAIADVNALLASVTFNPAANYNSNFTITTSVDDGVAPAITGVKNMSGIAVNDAPVLTQSTLTITEGGSVVLSASEISATDVDSFAGSLTFTVSSVTGGQFELVSNPGTEINSFTQAQVSAGEVRFMHDGGEAAPSYDVTVSDGSLSDGPAPATVNFTNQNDAPVLINNTLTLAEGGSVVLSPSEISASDEDSGNLTFIVSNVTGGHFQLVSNPGVAITTFTQVQVSNGEVSFVHDGGEAAPSYDVTVSDGSLSDGPAAATINFTNQNDAPALINNTLTITEGGSVVLSSINLSATDIDNATAGLTFTVSNVSGGQFELISNPGTEITSFTQAQVSGGEVRFVHDGGEAAPSYDVTVSDGSLSAGPAVATIDFANQNDAPILINNTLTISEGGSVVLSDSKLSATDAENDALTFTVSNVSGGRFELVSNPDVAITSFSQAQVSGGEVRFVHDGSEVAPSYDVTVSDGALSDGPAAATINFTNQNDAPILVKNTLTITEGGSVVLSDSKLSATDAENDGLTFTVSNVSGGRFELGSNPDVAITSFTQAQVSGGQVRFVHAGGELAPSYDVAVSDGSLSVGPAAATINFTNQNDAPLLTKNTLTITEGGSVVLSSSKLAATDVDNPAATLTFTVSNVSNGQFELVSNPGTEITSFTQAQVSGGEVRFVHDGGEAAPSYDVTVSDGSLSAGPAAATINFTNQNDSPVLTTNTLTITEGGTVVLSTSEISASDVETAAASLTFTVSNVSGGHFELVSTGATITTFTQAQVSSGEVRLVHDGGELAPSYDVTVSDGSLSDGPSAAKINFTNQNDAPVLTKNTLTITEGGTVVLSSSKLAATDVDNAAANLTFTVSSVSGGQFELVSNPGTVITIFTQSQVTGGEVRFVHDGGEAAPSYDVTVSDGALSDGPSAAKIKFTNQNDAPVLVRNTLTITEGASVVLSSTNLSATDVDNSQAGLTFTVSGVTGGHFELVSRPGTKITTFTQAQVSGGKVRFVHDGGEAAPSYYVRVSDGALSIGPAAATINFTNQDDPSELPEPPPVTELPEPPPVTEQPTGQDPVAQPVPGNTGQAPGDNPKSTDKPGSIPASPDGTENPSFPTQPNVGMGQFEVAVNITYIQQGQLMSTSSRSSSAPNERSNEVRNEILAHNEAPSVTPNSELEVTTASTASTADLSSLIDIDGFVKDLDQVRAELREDTSFDKVIVGSTLALTTGFSIGYIMWLVQGQILLSSVLASLPAWRLVDPLPVLAHLNKDSKKDGEDDDSIESVITRGADIPESNQVPNTHRGSRPVKWRMVMQPSELM